MSTAELLNQLVGYTEQKTRRIEVTRDVAAKGLLGFHGLALAVMGLQMGGMPIPIQLTVPVVFLALTFIPGGLAVLNIYSDIRLEDKHILYIFGISLIALMAIGVVVNVTLPLLGYETPMSRLPLAAAVTLFNVILGIPIIKEDHSGTISFTTEPVISPIPLSLLLLPLFTIIGVELLNRTGTNALLVVALVAVALVPLIVVRRRVSTTWHAFGVWTMALTVLYHKSLWKYWGYRGQPYAVRVWESKLWYPGITDPGPLSAELLPNGVLYPMYARVTGIHILTQYSVINPVFVSFLPVALFIAFREHTDSYKAFLGASVFIFAHPFFRQYPTAGRAATPVLFLALFGVAISDRKSSRVVATALSLLFILGITVSHYGTSYYVMAALGVALLLLVILQWIDRILEKVSLAIINRESGGVSFRAQIQESWGVFAGTAVATFGATYAAIAYGGGTYYNNRLRPIVPEAVRPPALPRIETLWGLPRTEAIVTTGMVAATAAVTAVLIYRIYLWLPTVSRMTATADQNVPHTLPSASYLRSQVGQVGSRLSASLVLFTSVSTLTWYMTLNGGRKFDQLPKHAIESYYGLIRGSTFSGRTAARLQKNYGTMSIQLSKYIYMSIGILIAFGLLVVLYRRFTNKHASFDDHYYAVAVAMLGIFGTTIMVRNWGGGRPMMITFVFTTIFAVIGLTAFEVYTLERDRRTIQLFGILLAALFILNSGVGAALFIGGFAPSNVPNQQQLAESPAPRAQVTIYKETDIATHVWMVHHHDELEVYGDTFANRQKDWYRPEIDSQTEGILSAWGPSGVIKDKPLGVSKLAEPGVERGYVFLIGHNLALNGVWDSQYGAKAASLDELELSERNRVYTTGKSEIYYYNGSI